MGLGSARAADFNRNESGGHALTGSHPALETRRIDELGSLDATFRLELPSGEVLEALALPDGGGLMLLSVTAPSEASAEPEGRWSRVWGALGRLARRKSFDSAE